MPLLKALNYTGVCEIEFINDPRDNRYKLIEINARTWLWVGLAIKCGINYPLYIYNYLNNLESVYSVSYPAATEWMHYATDLPFSALGFLKGIYNIKEIMSSYLRKPIPAVFDRNDIKPSLAELVLIPYFALNR